MWDSQRRIGRSESPVPVVLSDLHPHTGEWQRLSSSSSNKALSFLPNPVDATMAPASVKQERHFRSFCLSFHHFSEDAATRVLEDAMRTAEGIWSALLSSERTSANTAQYIRTARTDTGQHVHYPVLVPPLHAPHAIPAPKST